MTYVVTLRKHRSTWHYYTENPQGGGFGSNHCGAKSVALGAALRSVPAGAAYQLMTYHGETLVSSVSLVREES
jgi:hypothetical protein